MTKLKPTGAFALLCVACLTIMVGCVIVPGLPSISSALGVPNAASWLVTLPSLGVVVFAPLVGRMMDRVGAYKTLTVGLVLYGLIGLIGMWLMVPVVLYIDRFVLGGATAMVMASGTALISDFYEGEARLKMIAKQGMAIELGGVIFLAIGGVLATVGWQYPFLLYLSAWVFLALVLAFVPNPGHDTAESAATETKAGSAAKASENNGSVKDVFIAACMSQVLFFTAVIFMPARLANMGLSEDQAGYFMSFISLMAVAAAAMMPRLQMRLGGSLTLGLAFALYAVAHLLYTTGALPLMIVGAIFMGCGFGFSIPLVNHLIVERSSNRKRAQNLAYLSSAIFLGQFLSSFITFVSDDATSAFTVACVLSVVLAALFGFGAIMGKLRARQAG